MKKWEKVMAITLAIVGIWLFAGFFKIIPTDSKYSSLKMMCEFGEWYHSPKATVIDVNAKASSIILEDEQGESWVAFVDNYNEVKMGDKYKILFDDCDTPNYIYDDEVIDIKKI